MSQQVNDDEFYFDSTDAEPSAPAAPAVAVAEPAKQPPKSKQRPIAPEPADWAKQRAAESRKGRDGERQPLYFDLETVPDYSRLDSFGLDPLPPVPEETDVARMPDVKAIAMGTVEEAEKTLAKFAPCPSAWLDSLVAAESGEKTGKVKSSRAGVLDAIKKAREVRGTFIQAHDDRRKLLSTTPEYCRIAAMGYAIGNEEVRSLVIGDKHLGGKVLTERDILDQFWSLVAHYAGVGCAPLVGFNVLHFDLPVILVRSAILGVPSSRRIDLKPWGNDVVDIYAIRFPKADGSSGKPRKLKALAPLYGIEVPAGDCDGSRVEELLEKDPAALGNYVRSDVSITRGMHKALAGYFWA